MKKTEMAMRPVLRHLSRSWICPSPWDAFGIRRSDTRLQRQYCSANETGEKRWKQLSNGPGLKDFLVAGKNLPVRGRNTNETVPYLDDLDVNGGGRKVLFEVYGCQMNVNDTEVIWAILMNNGYLKADSLDQADIVLLITCAIREKAESKVSPLLSTTTVAEKSNP